MDLRNICLDQHRQAFDAVVSTLRDADEAVVAKADAAVAALPQVAECADIDALKRRPPVPDDPTQRAEGPAAAWSARRGRGASKCGPL